MKIKLLSILSKV